MKIVNVFVVWYLYFSIKINCILFSHKNLLQYLDLFLTRIDGLRRRISVAGELQVLDYAVIRDAFQVR